MEKVGVPLLEPMPHNIPYVIRMGNNQVCYRVCLDDGYVIEADEILDMAVVLGRADIAKVLLACGQEGKQNDDVHIRIPSLARQRRFNHKEILELSELQRSLFPQGAFIERVKRDAREVKRPIFRGITIGSNSDSDIN